MHSVSMTAYLATKGDLERLLLEWRQQHGPFFEFQVPGSPPVMVVSDPDAIREVRWGRFSRFGVLNCCAQHLSLRVKARASQ
jgi:cytochrome P450